MKNVNEFLACLGLTAVAFMAASLPAYADVAGHVQFVSGNVQVTSAAGQVRQAQKGGPINEGDMVSSAQQSSVQIKMQDGGFIAVRPNTKLKIEQFRFSGQADSGNDRSFFALIKGGFRSITGLIGQVNKQNYRVTTPAATIGIRGTDYEAVYTEAAPVNLAAAGMLMAVTDVPAPIMGGGFAAAVVNKGAIEMGTNKGTTLLQPGQGMVVSYGMNQLPVIKPLDVNLFPGAGKDQPSGQRGGKGENGEKKQGDAKDGGGAKGEEPSGENGKNGESDKTADSGQETTGGNPTADGGATGDAATEPVRETSVVDAAPPATGGVSAAVPPAVDTGMTTTLPTVPFVQPPTFVLSGQTVNLGTQTITPIGGGTAVSITGTSPLYPAPNGFGYEVLGVDAVGTWFNPFAINLPATSYLLDTTNNLMEVLGRVKFSGGVAKDTYKSADGSVYMGRWQGGTVTDQVAGVLNMGANSSQWVFAANPAAGYVQTLAGTTNYSLTAATHPTDALGNVGTLTSATLTADFTTQIVNISLALSFSTADAVNISTQNKAFVVTTPNGISISGQEIWGIGGVACTGANCDPAYTANIWARFAGSAADKVAIPYDITGNISDQVQGVALVSAPTAPLVSPVAPAGAVAPYTQTDKAFAFVTSSQDYLVPFAEIGTITGKPADMNNALPNPSFIDRNAGKDAASYIRYSLSGTTTVTAAVTTIAPTGISYGRYDSTQATKQVVGTTTAGAAGTTTTPNAVYMHWISGPGIAPIYLPEVLLGNSTYTFDGGTVPTDAFGAGATLDNATLSVNFTQQLVSFSLSLTVGGSPWTASTAGAGTPLTMLNGGNAKAGFMATTVARPGWGGLTVTGATQGDIVGQLTGNGLNGALLSYYLVGGSSQVSGVAAFSGAAQNTATSYRLVGMSASTANTNPAWYPGGPPYYPVPITQGGYNNTASVLMDGAGNLTQFKSDGMQNNSAFIIAKGAATATGRGSDPVSGISWGRWDGASYTTTNLATGAISTTNNNIGSAHWIASPALSGPVTLPVTGVFNYVRAGGTAPTDYVVGTQAVGVGTLNTATLSANFAAQTVNIGLNVTTPNAGTLIANAVNIPIQQGSMFNAATAGAINSNNNGTLTLTCGAGCVGTPQGEIGGAFAGPGGIGAAMLYGFSAGATNNILVNGAVAFHR